jgi:hypothetical protein
MTEHIENIPGQTKTLIRYGENKGAVKSAYINTIHFLVVVATATIREGDALPAEDEAVGEKTKEDALGEVHNRVPVHIKPLSAQIKQQAREQLGLQVRVSRHLSLGDLGYGRGGHGRCRHGSVEGRTQRGAWSKMSVGRCRAPSDAFSTPPAQHVDLGCCSK